MRAIRDKFPSEQYSWQTLGPVKGEEKESEAKFNGTLIEGVIIERTTLEWWRCDNDWIFDSYRQIKLALQQAHSCVACRGLLNQQIWLLHLGFELTWKQGDHRVGSLPVLIKKSLWATETSKYPWCLHPPVAEKWAGEGGIKRHRRTGTCLRSSVPVWRWT